ncbi:MAG: JAB domain-containing protein [Ruminococcaceae bacterium]|nr:JAB domain-containing protein [Oscillospiraceae bacterium]
MNEEYRTMKTMPEELRPYERLHSCGARSLSDSELIAIVLRSGTKGMTALELAYRIIEKYGSLKEIQAATVEELTELEGIGTAKAIMLLASLELGSRIVKGSCAGKLHVSNYGQIRDLLLAGMISLKKEEFAALLFDKKWNFLRKCTVAIGTVDQCPVHPREVFSGAIKHSASAIIIVHNHPTGDVTPSAADMETTKRLIEAGRIIGIDVVDHMIVGDGVVLSMYMEGMMPCI